MLSSIQQPLQLLPGATLAAKTFFLIDELYGISLFLRRQLEVADVYAKIETFNPGNSIKDRMAVKMIEDAERSGALKPGATIIEGTSGNTGVGLAIVAARKGYKCVFVCPDKVAPDKIAQLRAYGAEVVVCPTSVDPEHPESYYSVAARLARDIPGAFKPDQYWNMENPRAHEATTGPELWDQTDGRITHFVASVGTGGTVSGNTAGGTGGSITSFDAPPSTASPGWM